MCYIIMKMAAFWNFYGIMEKMTFWGNGMEQDHVLSVWGDFDQQVGGGLETFQT